MDGVNILLDGVCKPLFPYLGTPKAIRDRLAENPPDLVAFTHEHKDHFDDAYVAEYKQKTLRPVYGPESLHSATLCDGIQITMEKTRHIGKTDIAHVSIILKGSSCVWFMGDASPLVLKQLKGCPAPDVLIVPFAYAASPSAWRYTKETGADKIMILHMPGEGDDKDGIWETVRNTVRKDASVLIPEMGETIIF